MDDITRLLQVAREDGGDGVERLVAAVYHELRRMARAAMQNERGSHTLQPTALVHEAWMRLQTAGGAFDNRAHFFTAAGTAMRRILTEHARARAADKRGGVQQRTTLDATGLPDEHADAVVLAVHEALGDLGEASPEAAQLVELRFFVGLTVEEIAELLGVSPSTVARRWRVARAWLESRLPATGAAG